MSEELEQFSEEVKGINREAEIIHLASNPDECFDEDPFKQSQWRFGKKSELEQMEWGQMAQEIRSIYSNIIGIRDKLLHIAIHEEAHTMDDLRKYQQMLDGIDRRREDGIFGGSLLTGNIPSGQAACREALDEAYELLEELVESADALEPSMKSVQSMLAGIARKLSTLRDREYTWEDLRLYEQMINRVDSQRVDGIFCGSQQSHVPEGQASCSALLAHCYELTEELKENAKDMSPRMLQIHDRLLECRDTLREMKLYPELYNFRNIREMEDELDFLEQDRIDGVFGGNKSFVPPGQLVLKVMMKDSRKLVRQLKKIFKEKGSKECMEFVYPVLEDEEKPKEWAQMERPIRSIYCTLFYIRNELAILVEKKGKSQAVDPNSLQWFDQKLNHIDDIHRQGLLSFKAGKRGEPKGMESCRALIRDAYNLFYTLSHKPEVEGDSTRHRDLALLDKKIKQSVERGDVTKEEVQYFEENLAHLQTALVNTSEKDEACCQALVDSCQNSLTDMKKSAVDMDQSLKNTFNAVLEIRNKIRVCMADPTGTTRVDDMERLTAQLASIQDSKALVDMEHPGVSCIKGMIRDCLEDIEKVVDKLESSKM